MGNSNLGTELSGIPTPLHDLFDLSGQTALVTGGLHGLGRAIGLRLREAGADLIIGDVDAAAAPEVIEEMRKQAPGSAAISFVQADLTKESEVVRFITEAREVGGRLDILVNNAGIYPVGTALGLDGEVWERVLSLNLTAPFLCARETAKVMIADGTSGRIVNISSISAVYYPFPGQPHYCASKAGLNALTRTMAIEFGPSGIRVNGVGPGATVTQSQRERFGASEAPEGDYSSYPEQIREWIERMPLRRLASPDEQARAVLYLVSAASSYLTGQTILVDGGATLV